MGKDMKMKRIKQLIPIATSMILLFAFSVAGSSRVSAAIIDGAEQGGRPLATTMSGSEEAPGPGDPDGSGIAFFTLNQGQSTICFELSVENIATATAAHIHRAPAGSPGPVVVTLTAPASGTSSGCVSADSELIKEIRQSPAEFYVNVHNSEFTGGAVRGQLDG